jgi:hypothetical protein
MKNIYSIKVDLVHKLNVKASIYSVHKIILVQESQAMDLSLRYWNIWRISLKTDTPGYKSYPVPLAKDFLEKLPTDLKANTKEVIFSYFHGENSNADIITRAQAGLCLRCYVSEPILKACQKIDNLFSGDKAFSYHDLLSFVLNDDGKTLVIGDIDGKKQLIIKSDGTSDIATYNFFTVKVLQTFKIHYNSRMSLDNWAFLQTRQNPDIKDFLSEHGFKNLSDWALLNRARPKQLERLSERDKQIIKAFHAVYRRDRALQKKVGGKKCPEPSHLQLEEMISLLKKQNVIINKTSELIKELKIVVTQLRHFDIWNCREPLEIYDADTEIYTTRNDIVTESINEVELEQQEILQVLHSTINLALSQTIKQELIARISYLEKSKKYTPLAKQFIPGMHLYYFRGMSLKEIAPLLGMSSWDQARRILNPGELLSNVRALFIKKLMDKMLELAEKKGLTQIPPNPDYLKNLAEQIEAFADEEIFQKAAEEIRAGKSRLMDSLYAQQLRISLQNIQKNIHQCVAS